MWWDWERTQRGSTQYGCVTEAVHERAKNGTFSTLLIH